MKRWAVCDENWFWYLSFSGPKAENGYREEINLWPCRWCGAMVMGVRRTQHERFHDAVGRPEFSSEESTG